jgi:hypothetical protein
VSNLAVWEKEPLKHLLALLLGCVALLIVSPGCDSGAPPEAGPGGTLGEAGPNRRLKLRDEYKQAIGKDGKMILKPGMKKPDFAAKPQP